MGGSSCCQILLWLFAIQLSSQYELTKEWNFYKKRRTAILTSFWHHGVPLKIEHRGLRRASDWALIMQSAEMGSQTVIARGQTMTTLLVRPNRPRHDCPRVVIAGNGGGNTWPPPQSRPINLMRGNAYMFIIGLQCIAWTDRECQYVVWNSDAKGLPGEQAHRVVRLRHDEMIIWVWHARFWMREKFRNYA